MDKNKSDEFEEMLKRVSTLESALEEDGEIDIDYDAIIQEFGLDVEELERAMESMQPTIKLHYSKSNSDAMSPSYAYPTDSGMDLYSTETITINAFGRGLIPTGIHFDIPDNYEIQVRSKSGLALNQGLMVLNSPGTVDQGYTGEIKVIIFNTTSNPVEIKKGQKIAQAVMTPVVCGKWIDLTEVDNVASKDREDKGFGSTGI
jgi:dUTP pyrophosphatase